ncbi:hypothetical protein NDI44_20590 [Trichocoleus sp. DQ-A3]|uniref:hypothetical protein n=1 Tax=Cyanophyceae TaxID=3028117 RepID=UPI0016861C1F|nr:hypothetical protein [Coleofasciculus sp. FACHB-125]MBD1899842.1 hypothetical protein [Coleofasciculus sp. FACHB-125]
MLRLGVTKDTTQSGKACSTLISATTAGKVGEVFALIRLKFQLQAGEVTRYWSDRFNISPILSFLCASVLHFYNKEKARSHPFNQPRDRS